MRKYYPDISHYNTVNNWKEVEEHCPFLISKATQGTTFVDSTLEEVVDECERRKISYWLYTYLNKGNELSQTRFLVDTCRKKVGKYFQGYCLDVEAGNTPHNVENSMDYLRKLEYKMMLYTMYAEYDRYRDIIESRPHKCAWWEARYGLNNGRYDADYPCHEGVDLHQYTSAGRCPGIAGEVDLNRITGMGKSERWFTTPLYV